MIKLQDKTTYLSPSKFHLEFSFPIIEAKGMLYNTYNEIYTDLRYYASEKSTNYLLSVSVRHSLKKDITSENFIFWATLEDVNIQDKLINLDHFIKNMKQKCKSLLLLHKK